MNIDRIDANANLSQRTQRCLGATALALMVFLSWIGLSGLAMGADDGVVPDQYIIKLRPNQSAVAVANEMALIHGLGVGHI